MTTRTWTISNFAAADQEPVKALILAGLADQWGTLNPTLNTDLNDIQASYAPVNGHTIVAKIGNLIVGTGTIKEIDRLTGELVRMSVSRHHRGQGLGKGLVRALAEIGRERGYTRLVCETTDTWQDAIGLYLAFGFTIVDRREGDVYFEMPI